MSAFGQSCGVETMGALRNRLAVGVVLAAGVAAAVAVAAPAGGIIDIDLDQGWSAKTAAAWTGANQGSRLLPLAWFKALEQPGDGGGLFLDPAYMAGFRYLPGDDGLPLGFTTDGQDDRRFVETKRRWVAGQGSREPWVGMTCGACHTSELRYGPHRMRIHGGATLADFQSFLAAFNTSLEQTASQDARFERFAGRVLAPGADAAAKALLRSELQRTVTYQLALAKMNAAPIAYGYGRLDAIGHINNKIAFVAQPYAAKGNTPDAPVSYPFLWNVPQQSVIEWNGSVRAIRAPTAEPFDLGAVGRNVGEVVGVFGEVIAPDDPRSSRFVSSVHVNNLIYLEQQVGKLKPPRWPTEIFPVDATLAAEGRDLYRQQCASCHVELSRDDLKTRTGPDGKPLERMTPILAAEGETAGTDPWMACNATLNTAATGKLEGRRIARGEGPFAESATSLAMLTHVVKGIMVNEIPALAKAALQSAVGREATPRRYGSGVRPMGQADDPYAARRAACEARSRPGGVATLAYKARPLTGAWATAPFLHNGSVPTLYDLLLPPAERPVRFNLGTREFDPVRVGYVTAPGLDNDFVFRVRDDRGRIIEGNSNAGHDYGNADLTSRQRWAIVEYMKVMGDYRAPPPTRISWPAPAGAARRP